MRGKPNFKPTQYSIEWANIVTSHLKKQLGDVVLPSAPRPGLTIRQTTFQNVLGNPESRAKWVARFSHSLVLLREFFAESLVDHATFLTWLASLAGTANLAQAGLVSLVADEYLEGLVEHRGFLRPFLEGCLGKLGEVSICHLLVTCFLPLTCMISVILDRSKSCEGILVTRRCFLVQLDPGEKFVINDFASVTHTFQRGLFLLPRTVLFPSVSGIHIMPLFVLSWSTLPNLLFPSLHQTRTTEGRLSCYLCWLKYFTTSMQEILL